ncbi:MAG: hypothetical protein ABMB14_40690, partial [Myxococcota bacterium]
FDPGRCRTPERYVHGSNAAITQDVRCPGVEPGRRTTVCRRGEIFLIHTHPVLQSDPGHFFRDWDERSNATWEMVLDWSGNAIFFRPADPGTFRNPRDLERGGWLIGLPEFRTDFLDDAGDIVGYPQEMLDGLARRPS